MPLSVWHIRLYGSHSFVLHAAGRHACRPAVLLYVVFLYRGMREVTCFCQNGRKDIFLPNCGASAPQQKNDLVIPVFNGFT